MLIINFEGREAKGLSNGRYDETFAGEDAGSHAFHQFKLILAMLIKITKIISVKIFSNLTQAFS